MSSATPIYRPSKKRSSGENWYVRRWTRYKRRWHLLQKRNQETRGLKRQDYGSGLRVRIFSKRPINRRGPIWKICRFLGGGDLQVKRESQLSYFSASRRRDRLSPCFRQMVFVALE